MTLQQTHHGNPVQKSLIFQCRKQCLGHGHNSLIRYSQWIQLVSLKVVVLGIGEVCHFGHCCRAEDLRVMKIHDVFLPVAQPLNIVARHIIYDSMKSPIMAIVMVNSGPPCLSVLKSLPPLVVK